MCRTVWLTFKDFDPMCDIRQALDVADACVEFADVTMKCTAGNEKPNIPVTVESGAYPRIRCRSCGVAPLLSDANPHPGVWSGTVTWGPNQYEDLISESSIESYRLYVVYDFLRKLGEPVAEMTAALWANQFNASKCDVTYYKVTQDIVLPDGFAYFMVVPFTRGGLELSVGSLSQRIQDDGRVAVASSCIRGGMARLSWLVAVLLWRLGFPA